MASKSLIALLLLALAGCTYTDTTGVRHRVIIGFGVVSVGSTNSPAQVIKSTAIGIGFAGAPTRCHVGYSTDIITVIKTNANVIIEVK